MVESIVRTYRVENIVRKGEIASDKQFRLFSHFPQPYIVCQNAVLCGNGLKESNTY